MAFVICEPCVDVKDTACVAVCPVDCIYDFEGEHQLYIHPEECIDCAACQPECPVEAIFPEAEVPAQWQSYIEANRTIFQTRSKDEAIGGEAEPAGGAEEAAEERPAAAAPAPLAGSIKVASLSRDRVLRVLQTVEEGVIDANVALIQLTGLEPQAAPTPAPATTPKPAAKPATPTETAPPPALDPDYPDAVHEHAKVVPAERRVRVVEDEQVAEEPTPAEEPQVAAVVEEKVGAPELPPARPDRVVMGVGGFLLRISQPLLGALRARDKYILEGYAGHGTFNAAFATWSNTALNLVVYYIIAQRLAQSVLGEAWASNGLTNLFLFAGLGYGFVEGLIRTWSATVWTGDTPPHRQYKASLYGWLVSWVVWPIVLAVVRGISHGPEEEIRPPEKPIPGGAVYGPDELEKRRRYGMVHSVRQTHDGYVITMEMPRETPQSLRKREQPLPAELPDYKFEITADAGRLHVCGFLDDPRFADAVNRDADFPGSFLTEFLLPDSDSQFLSRYDPERKELTIHVAKRGRRFLFDDVDEMPRAS